MHDFLQLQSYSPTRHAASASRYAVPEWVQRGLMRSFGDDDLAAYRPSPQPSVRHNRKSRVQNRK